MIYKIIPYPKPRMVRSDKWKKRACVMRYRAFADEVRRLEITIKESGDFVRFYIPMPKTWSRAKKDRMRLTPHRCRPDVDNLLKSLLDAIFEDDSHIYDIRVKKIWDDEGGIGL
uniref:Putative endodeoxyribonuclease n=1 Tax=viral metagenome TaxID=1070528 RepID=A0A6M3JKR9_9ZZZZ